MLRIRDIAMGPEQDVTALLFEAAKILRVSAAEIQSVSLVRRSVDARKKPDVKSSVVQSPLWLRQKP